MTYLVEEVSYSMSKDSHENLSKKLQIPDIQSEHRTPFIIPKSKHVGNGHEERGNCLRKKYRTKGFNHIKTQIMCLSLRESKGRRDQRVFTASEFE